MAKEKTGSTNAEYVPKESTKMGDVVTAAKSTMGDGDYSQGYPRNTGALENRNSFPSKKKG